MKISMILFESTLCQSVYDGFFPVAFAMQKWDFGANRAEQSGDASENKIEWKKKQNKKRGKSWKLRA